MTFRINAETYTMLIRVTTAQVCDATDYAQGTERSQHKILNYSIYFKPKNWPHTLIFAPAGLTRPAPAEPSQGRKAARVGG